MYLKKIDIVRVFGNLRTTIDQKEIKKSREKEKQLLFKCNYHRSFH